MKIGVCAKVTPHAEARIKIASDGSGIDTTGEKRKVSDWDEYAVEEGIRTKEAHGGEVVAITVGDAADDKLLLSGALAMGADRAILVQDDADNSLRVAKILAAAIRKEGCDIVFTGKATTDGGSATVSAMLAELLGWAQVTQVTAFKLEGDTFTATRDMDGGVKQIVSGKLPAVIICEDGLNTPRYPKLPDIMKAKKKPFEKISAADLGVADDGAARYAAGSFAPPPARPKGRILEGDAATAAAELVRLLRDEAKVL